MVLYTHYALFTEHLMNAEITKMPSSFYSVLCNRWISLFGVGAKIMFDTNSILICYHGPSQF